MPDELESKLRVSEHDSVRRRLREHQAVYVGCVVETNRILDDANGTLFQTGCGLRVRECRVVDGTGQQATLTYKGPQRPGPFKRRSEIEVEVVDAAAMIEILGALGFVERFIFEKKRESWRLADCRVELDEVATLGLFVEVEGPNEEAIESTMALLGLGESELIRKSYVAMLAESVPSPANYPLEFRFS